MEFTTDEIAVAGIKENRNNASVLQPWRLRFGKCETLCPNSDVTNYVLGLSTANLGCSRRARAHSTQI